MAKYKHLTFKETFRDIYITAKDRSEASKMFGEWLRTVPPYPTFEPMRKTMSKRSEHILNYWDAPYTNAYTESVNNLIKKIEKAGRGYKFDTLRERCMLEINAEKPDKFNPKEAIFVNSDEKTHILTDKVGKLYMSVLPSKEIKSAEVDYIFLKDAVSLYFEYFDRTKHIESTATRLKAYAEAIRKLVH